MIEVLKYAKMAKTSDGGYHQFLYQMGYTPKGKINSIVGTQADNTAPCCNKYPPLGDATCTKTIGSAQSYTISSGQTCGEGFICKTGCRFGQCDSSSCNCEGEIGAVESYSYYNCKNDSLNTATTNKLICEAYFKCDTDSLPVSFSSFNNCPPSPSAWCDCNNFMVGAKSNFFEREITLNHNNQLCIK